MYMTTMNHLNAMMYVSMDLKHLNMKHLKHVNMREGSVGLWL
jgi:hypothetical protein